MNLNTIASGQVSAAFGAYTIAGSSSTFAIGKCNVGWGTPGSFVATDPIFEIGIGNYNNPSDIIRKNAMTVLKNGNVGIGTIDQFGGGVGILSIGNADTDPSVTLTNAAALYASGGELYSYDSAGNATLISPHDQETGEGIFYSRNTITGRVVKVNMEKLVKKIEELTGETFMEEWIDN